MGTYRMKKNGNTLLYCDKNVIHRKAHRKMKTVKNGKIAKFIEIKNYPQYQKKKKKKKHDEKKSTHAYTQLTKLFV